MALLTAPFPQSNVDLAGISRTAMQDLQRRQAQEEQYRAHAIEQQNASWKMAASMIMNIQDQQWKSREAARREQNDLAQLAMETRKLELQEQQIEAMSDYRSRAYDPTRNPLLGAKIETEQARADATAALAEQRKATTPTPEQQAQKAQLEEERLKGQSLLNKNRELDAAKKENELTNPQAKPASPSSVSAAAGNQFGVQRDRIEQTRANISSADKNRLAIEKNLAEAEERLKEQELIAGSYDEDKKARNPQGFKMVEADANAARTEVEKLRKKIKDTKVTIFKPDGSTAEVPLDEARAYHTEWNRNLMNEEESFRKQGVLPKPGAPAAGPATRTPGVSEGPGPTPHRNPTDGLPLPSVSLERFKASNGLDDATMSVVSDILFGS